MNELETLASMVDHTILKPYADHEMIMKTVRECIEYHFAMIAVNSCQVKFCHEALKGTGVHVGAAISFPLGQTELSVKCFETETAIEQGADEIDYVVNLTELKNGNWDYIRKEMESIVGICRKHQVLCKVIFETCYLTEQQIITLAHIAREVKPDFIKTSTGFGTAGADVKQVALMKKEVGEDVGVKAAGGIRDLKTFLAMKKAGATRIGCSASVKIMKEAEEALSRGEKL